MDSGGIEGIQAVSCCHAASAPAFVEIPQARGWGRLIGALFIAGNSMALSLAVNISESSPQERLGLCTVLTLATVFVVALAGRPLAQQLRSAWRERRLGIEGLFASGIFGATCYSLVSVWRGQGAVYFEVVSILIVIYALATQLKQESQTRLHAALRAALPDAELCRRVRAEGGLEERVAVRELSAGDTVEVRAGELIPLDGEVMRGAAYVNEATLTGEGFCVARQLGDTVRAGTRSIDGTLHVRALTSGAQRGLDRLFDQVLRGQAQRSSLESLVQRLGRWFFPCVASVSVVTFAVWFALGDLTAAFLNAMAVLLVACPCALGFATPIGLWTSVVRLSRLGVYTRHTEAVERFAEVDTVVFDKTGTLCTMDPEVKRVVMMADCQYTESQVVGMACAAQQLSDHPIAKVFTALQPDGVPSIYRPSHVQILPGRGIAVRFDAGQRTCTLGDISALAGAFAPASQALPVLSPGARGIGIFIDTELCAVAEVLDQPADAATGVLQGLSELGLRCAIYSGDQTERLAAFTSVEAVGDLTPTDKATRVAALQKQGHRVCFVGDGCNDAPAMAHSTVSIAIAQGAPLALASADFVLGRADLRHLPEVARICKQTLRVVRTNLIFAASYNALGIAVAACGLLHPVFAAVLMLCASFSVTLRSAALLNDARLTS